MITRSAAAVAFAMPGGEGSAGPRSRARPVDLTHLSRQTLGDRALEQEVLQLFVQQALSVRDQIAEAGKSERLRLAHGLKGSARGVGYTPDAKLPPESSGWCRCDRGLRD